MSESAMAVEKTTGADNAPFLERAFEIEAVEESYAIADVRGEVPEYVRGTYYVNGPGRFARGPVRYGHWLDGDGLVQALRFEPGRVRYAARFVRGPKYVEEEEAGRALYRAFGTGFEGDRLVRGIALASPMNVSVYPMAGTVLAFGEQGLPVELDPVTLETRGEYTFGRRLNAISPFSAHPHVDPASGEIFNFGVSFSSTSPCLNLYRFSAAGELLERRRSPLEHPTSVHDFGLGPRHAVFYLSPYVLDMAALQRGATLQQALAWRPELGSRLRLLERQGGETVAEVEVGSGYCLHLVGAFERGGRLVVDVVELDRPVYDQYDLPGLFPEARGARPVRYEVDLEGGDLAAREELDYDRMCDFPAIDPRLAGLDYGRFWVLGISASERQGRKFFDELVCCDWRLGRPAGRWRAPAGSYLGGEPVFLPDLENEGRGAIVCQRFDAEGRQSSFLVFDAHDVSRGPLAELTLRRPAPLGFHASYDPRPAGT